METNGAMPVPVATKTGGRSDSRNVNKPWGPSMVQAAPSAAAARTGESDPVGINRTHSERGSSSLPLAIE